MNDKRPHEISMNHNTHLTWFTSSESTRTFAPWSPISVFHRFRLRSVYVDCCQWSDGSCENQDRHLTWFSFKESAKYFAPWSPISLRETSSVWSVYSDGWQWLWETWKYNNTLILLDLPSANQPNTSLLRHQFDYAKDPDCGSSIQIGHNDNTRDVRVTTIILLDSLSVHQQKISFLHHLFRCPISSDCQASIDIDEDV